MNDGRGFLLGLLLTGVGAWAGETANYQPIAEPGSIWSAGEHEGFKLGTREILLSGGIGAGMAVWGTREHHDWWISSLDFGYVVSDTVGKGRWYAGNFEVVGEVFGGEQFHPTHAYFVGGGPHVRYNFVTDTRWVPFVDVGAGLSATDIRNGDLSTTMEFNLQAGGGIRMFLTEEASVVLQYRLIHLSNAGMQYPNLGVNSSTVMLGLSWIF